MRFSPEIIAITDTKLQANRVFHSKLQGYNCIRADSLTCAGVVAFLIKSTLNYQIKDDLNIFVPACENHWIEINHPDEKGIVIGIVYRHPQHDHSEFQEAFQENILKINKNKKVFYACGDYDINLLQSDANHNIASYLNSVTSTGSFCLIDKPSRLGESSATLLDHFYTNNLTTPITSGILESDISDHLPTFVLIRSYIPPYSSASYKFRRHLNKIGYEQFNNELDDILQNKLSHNGMDIHQKFDTLISTLKNLQDKHAPLIRQSRRERKLAQKPGSPKQLWFQSVIKIGSFLKSAKIASPLLRMHAKNIAIYSHG